MINNELQNLLRNGIMGIARKGVHGRLGEVPISLGSDVQGRSIKERQIASCRAEVHEFEYPVHGSPLIILHPPNRFKHRLEEISRLGGGRGYLYSNSN